MPKTHKKKNKGLIRYARELAYINHHTLSYSIVCSYVGYEDAGKAFDAIHKLWILEGYMSQPLLQISDEWRTRVREWVSHNEPDLAKDIEGLI